MGPRWLLLWLLLQRRRWIDAAIAYLEALNSASGRGPKEAGDKRSKSGTGGSPAKRSRKETADENEDAADAKDQDGEDDEDDEELEEKIRRDSENLVKAVAELRKWLDPRGSRTFPDLGSGVNYNNVPAGVPECLQSVGLSGLFWFVHHSDCEGLLSPGQALDCMCTLERIAPFLPDLEGPLDTAAAVDVTPRHEQHHLWHLMDAAVRRRVDIEFK